MPELAPACQPCVLLLGMGSFPDQFGGLNRYFRDLRGALQQRGVNAPAVVLGPVADPPLGLRQACLVDDRLASRLWRFSRTALQVGREADLIDAHFALYALLPTTFGRLRRLPLVVHFQGPWAEESAGVGERRRWVLSTKLCLERVVYRRADEAVVLSGAFKRILVEQYRVIPWRIHVIAPGVDLKHFLPGPASAARAALGISEDHWVCLTVRRLVPRMGIDVLLAAWRDLAQGRENLTLLIAGDGPGREDLEARVADLGIGAAVRFLGMVDEDDLVRCYRAADVCVVPSVALEGFGLVVLEALSCGTPVIATDVGGLPEALSRLDPSLVVPAGDAVALAARLDGAIKRLQPLPDPGQCRAHAEGFSWDAAALENLEVYDRARAPQAHRRLRVVYLDHCASLSGGELALLRILPALDEVEPHLILAQDGPLVTRLVHSGVSVEVLPMDSATRDLHRDRVRPGAFPLKAGIDSAVYVARLARRLRRLRPDLVHTNSLKSALYGGLAARIAGVPVIWHVRDRIASDYLPGPAVRLVRLLSRCLPQAVIANSQATLETLANRVASSQSVVFDAAWQRGRASVIHSPVVAGWRTPHAAARTAGELRIGMVGRLAHWKGQHVFLSAFAEAFPDGGARAIIVGAPLFGESDYEVELKELVSRLDVSHRVEFLGFVEDVHGQLVTFDVLVHASVIPEPFGQVVVEGMAAGIPVVASAAGGPAEVIRDGVNGLLTPPGDVEALAQALRELAANPDLRLRLGAAGHATSKDFSPEAIGVRVMKVYRALLDGVRR